MTESPQSSVHAKSKPSIWIIGLAVLAIVFGAFMITIAPVYASQTHYQMVESDTVSNITLQPGAQQFWFSEGDNGGGVRNIIYYAITSPSSPTNNVEFRATAAGVSINGTIFSTVADYIQTSFTIPAGTKNVNYTLFNPTQSPMTVDGAEVRFYDVSYPSLWIASLLNYLGIAAILLGLVAVGAWLLIRRKI